MLPSLSLHRPGPRYSKVLLPAMEDEVKALVAPLLPAHADARVAHLHAFDIQYSAAPEVAQVALGRHRDNSSYTRNVCVAVSEDLAYVGVVRWGQGPGR